MNGTLYPRYTDVIQDYLQQGICEDVPENASAAETLSALSVTTTATEILSHEHV